MACLVASGLSDLQQLLATPRRIRRDRSSSLQLVHYQRRTDTNIFTDVVKGICDEGERLCTESDDELRDEEGPGDDDGRDEALFLRGFEAHVEFKSAVGDGPVLQQPLLSTLGDSW